MQARINFALPNWKEKGKESFAPLPSRSVGFPLYSDTLTTRPAFVACSLCPFITQSLSLHSTCAPCAVTVYNVPPVLNFHKIYFYKKLGICCESFLTPLVYCVINSRTRLRNGVANSFQLRQHGPSISNIKKSTRVKNRYLKFVNQPNDYTKKFPRCQQSVWNI